MIYYRLHAWGDTMEEAFEQCAVAMFGYMTDLERVEMTQLHYVEAEGHDMESLLFHFLDELLFMFSAEPYIVAKVFHFSNNNFIIIILKIFFQLHQLFVQRFFDFLFLMREYLFNKSSILICDFSNNLKNKIQYSLPSVFYYFKNFVRESIILCYQKVKIIKFDRENFKINAMALGEEFTIGKHTQNAEVKAITYSAMQILESSERECPEIFVIVDI